MSNRTEKPDLVSELLKLKRYERPQAAFWTQFDAQLKQKLLWQSLKPKASLWERARNNWARVVKGFVLCSSAACACLVALFSSLSTQATPLLVSELQNKHAHTGHVMAYSSLQSSANTHYANSTLNIASSTSSASHLAF